MTPPTVAAKVWGEFALFTRPELKVERLSYPFLTPSAARGILDAILFKPQMTWHVRRITALEPAFPAGFPAEAARLPYRLISIRRNEISGKIITRNVEGWMRDPEAAVPYLVDSAGREGVQGQNRTQRNSLALHHVAYLIEASPFLTEKANRPRTQPPDDDEGQGLDTVAKYVAMFQRRVSKGQCFHRPYLGCREFACAFAAPDGTEQPLSGWTEGFGLMLYDIRFGADGRNQPGFFDAHVSSGVMHCDIQDHGPNGEPPVRVYGWDVEEATA